MNPLEQLCTENVSIRKPEGREFGPYKCTLANSEVVIFNENLDVDEGDTVLRELPTGKIESYTVLEVNYAANFHAIPAHYKLKVRKDSSLITHNTPQSTTINISNSHGIQIGDHNIQHIVNSFRDMIDEINKSNVSSKDKHEAKQLLRKFLEHPLICSLLGGAIGTLTNVLGRP